MSPRYSLSAAVQSLWNDGAHAQFSKTSLGVLIAKVFGVLIAFAVQIPLARLLGAESYGAYVFVFSWVAIAGIVAGLGMETTFVRYLPTCVAEKKWPQLKGVITFGFTGALIACALLTVIVYGAFYGVSGRNSSFFPFIGAGAALLFAMVAAQLAKAALRGLHLVLLSEIMESVARPILVLAVFLVLFFGLSADGAQLVLWANVATFLAMFAALSFHLMRRLPVPARAATPDFGEWRDWMGLALPVVLMSGMGLLLNRTDIIMLGSIAGSAEAGIYAIGSRFAELAALGLVAANTVLAPRISELYHSDRRQQLQKILQAAAWFSFGFAVCVAVVLIAVGAFLLALFGEGFAGAYMPMLILLAGQAINAMAGSVGHLLILTGRQNEAAAVLFVVVIVNVIGNFVLIPLYGMNGAAIATGASIILWNLLLFVRVARKLRLNPSVLPLRIA